MCESSLPGDLCKSLVANTENVETSAAGGILDFQEMQY